MGEARGGRVANKVFQECRSEGWERGTIRQKGCLTIEREAWSSFEPSVFIICSRLTSVPILLLETVGTQNLEEAKSTLQAVSQFYQRGMCYLTALWHTQLL